MDTIPFVIVAIVGALALIFLVLYALAPFVLYFINRKLTETNRLLEQLVARSAPPPQREAPPISPEPVPEQPTMFRSLG